MAKDYKYTPLSECEDGFSSTGYFIVEDQVHQVKQGNVLETWDIDGKTNSEKVASARKEAELPSNARIFVDDIGMFDNDVIADHGKLVTYDDSMDLLDEEERDGLMDLEEYVLNH